MQWGVNWRYKTNGFVEVAGCAQGFEVGRDEDPDEGVQAYREENHYIKPVSPGPFVAIQLTLLQNKSPHRTFERLQYNPLGTLIHKRRVLPLLHIALPELWPFATGSDSLRPGTISCDADVAAKEER